MRASLILALALTFVGCGSSHSFSSSDGHTISERHGRIFVGDVALDHKREVVLEGELGGEAWIALATAGGPMEISGAPGDGYRLVVELYSEFADDGDVELDGGRLVALPGKGRSLVHAVRGVLPEAISLDLASGTGDMVVRTLVGDNELAVDTGTGSLRVADCDLTGLRVDSGTGDVNIEGCTIRSAICSTGTADVVSVESRIGRLQVTSGTGDVRLRRCKLEDLDVTSGTGDLLLIDSSATSLRSTLATGEIVAKLADGD